MNLEDYPNHLKVKKGDILNKEIEIEEINKVFENKFVKVYNDFVIFPNNSKGNYFRIKYNHPYGVVVAPIDNDGNLLLIKNFRHENRFWTIDACMGMGEEKLLPIECAQKELMEELGLKSDNIIKIKEYLENGVSSTIFSAKELYKDKSILDKKEAISGVVKVNKKEAKNFLLSDDVHLPITMTVINMYLAGLFD